jgi:hypothetical protein
MKREQPQIDPSVFRPVLEQKSLTRGQKLHKFNDQKQVHWQCDTLIFKGVDYKKKAFICRTLEGSPAIIEFKDLDQWNVNVGHA